MMNKPTLHEIEEAIRTLTSAGMLLNAEQTIAVNRVRREIEQQAVEEARRQREEERRGREELRRQREEEDKARPEWKSIEEEASNRSIQASQIQRISLNDYVPHGAIWNAMNNRRLRTAFKKHMYATGTSGSKCTFRMAYLSKKLKEINRVSEYKAMVLNCHTFAEMHQVLRSLIVCWGQESSYGWSQKFFINFLDFIQENFPRQIEPTPDPQPQDLPPTTQPIKVTKESQQEQQTLFPDKEPKKKRRQVQLIDANGRRQTLDPFEALKVVVLKVGCEKVAKMGIQVGRTKLLRLSQPIGTKSYTQLNRFYWLQNRGTVFEIYLNILKIIEIDNHVHFKDVILISPNNA